MRRLTHLVVLAAFVFSCGGQWYLVQGIAWIKMIHDYSESVPLSQAISMTFSGQYPCEICKALAEKKPSENDKLWSFDKYQKKFFPPVALALAQLKAAPLLYPRYRTFLQTRAETPPVPPPRFVLA